jgi:hypothetical protein
MKRPAKYNTGVSASQAKLYYHGEKIFLIYHQLF